MRKPRKPIKPLLAQAEQFVNDGRRKDRKSAEKRRRREETEQHADFMEKLRQAGVNLVMVNPYSVALRKAGPSEPVPEDMPWIVEQVKVFAATLALRSQPGIFADHEILLADAKTKVERVTRAHELLCQATETLEEAQRTAFRALPGKAGFAKFLAEFGATGKEFWHPEDASEKLNNTMMAMKARGEQVPEKCQQAYEDAANHIGTFLLAMITYYTTIAEAYRHLDGGESLAQIKVLLATSPPTN
ncbi:MAG: hypothetical protein OXD43_03980 [Bacteroidetes bacterium]|nr:hypothetical protein [Bacteroidota bacterium]